MLVNFENRTWEFDPSDVTVKQAMVIQGYTGLSVSKWIDSMNDDVDGDGNVVRAAADSPDFIKGFVAMYWLMKQQNGVVCAIGDCDFLIGAFGIALQEAQAADEAAKPAAAEPDPTQPPPPPVWEPSPEPGTPILTPSGPADADARYLGG